jgi:hypothetical protein
MALRLSGGPSQFPQQASALAVFPGDLSPIQPRSSQPINSGTTLARQDR